MSQWILSPLCILSKLQGNLSNFDLVMESDAGTFAPVALQFSGSSAAQKVRAHFDDFAVKTFN